MAASTKNTDGRSRGSKKEEKGRARAKYIKLLCILNCHSDLFNNPLLGKNENSTANRKLSVTKGQIIMQKLWQRLNLIIPFKLHSTDWKCTKNLTFPILNVFTNIY